LTAGERFEPFARLASNVFPVSHASPSEELREDPRERFEVREASEPFGCDPVQDDFFPEMRGVFEPEDIVALGEDDLASRREGRSLGPRIVEGHDLEGVVQEVRPPEPPDDGHADAVSFRPEGGVPRKGLPVDADLREGEFGGPAAADAQVPVPERLDGQGWSRLAGASWLPRHAPPTFRLPYIHVQSLISGVRRLCPGICDDGGRDGLRFLVTIRLSRTRMYRDSGNPTAIGFVLIDIEPNREKEVYEKLLKVRGIAELYPLFGDYDLIAKVEAESFDAIGDLVVEKVRTIEGVKATKTLARMTF